VEYFIQSLLAAGRLLLAFDNNLWLIVWTSLRITLSAIIIACAFSIPLAIWIGLHQFPGKRLLHNILNTLMAVPTVMIGLILYGLLSRRGALGELGLLYTPSAIIIGQVVLILPIIIGFTLSAIESEDRNLVITLKSLGATTSQQIWLLLKEMKLLISAGVVLAFGRAIGEVGAAMMLGGNIAGQTRTMTTAIALQTSKGEFEQGLALGIVLLSIAFILNAAMQRLQHQTT
jgi:tungstate transport system permease protein